MRKLILIFVIYLFNGHLKAQQFGLLTSHMFNQNLLSPAETGNDGSLEASLITRRKITGFKGAPQWTIFNIHSAFRNENVAAGLNVIRYTAGHSTRNHLVFNYRYRTNFSKNKYLQFGLSGSLENETMNWSDAIANDTDDPILVPQSTNSFRPNVGAAFHLRILKFYAGIAVPTFFNSVRGDYSNSFKAHLRINSYVGCAVINKKDLQLKVEIFSRSYQLAHYLIESTVHAAYNEIIEVGIGYRSNNSYYAVLGTGLNEQIRISYAFDVFNSYFIAHPAYYHEVNLRYVLVYKNKAKNTSFI